MAKRTKKEKAATTKEKKKPAPATRKVKSRKAFPVVAIGGSAGSFEALEKFFANMPAGTGIAFVIVTHLDPTQKGLLPGLLQQCTAMHVQEVQDGMKIEPDNVYIIPPNRDMSVHVGTLLLLEPSKPRVMRMPIDFFFQSIAHDMSERVVGIILSGMGADGELGLKVVKEYLGMTMVQDPETAEHEDMPLAAIDTGFADYILPPEEMPDYLLAYLNHPAILQDAPDRNIGRVNNALQKIFMLLRSHTGQDFSLYKQNTILRRIDRRIAFHQLNDIVEYVHYLRENPHELDILFKELLIGVTKFFRDTPVFEHLKQEMLPIMRKKMKGDTVRVWIAGCSTGEEAYSIAMLLTECMDHLPAKHSLKLQIFATDLDHAAVEHARNGIYQNNITADLTIERLERFFIKKDEQYQVKKELREMVVFAQHNVIKDAPFTKLDLLCCRNLLIYLTADLQKKIIPIFHYALNPDGVLFLGPSETIGGYNDLFSQANTKWKIFHRRKTESALNRMIDFPFAISRQEIKIPRVAPNPKAAKKVTLAESFHGYLLESYTPPSVIINQKGDILYINGRMGRYMELNSGHAAMNIYRMVKEELKYEVGNAIHRAVAERKKIVADGIKLKRPEETRLLCISAEYMDETSPLQGLVIVVFEDRGSVKPVARQGKNADGKSDGDRQVAELEKELIYTRQQLQTTIEQMETSVEELRSTNEELQSTNEELQSTNEESITTKEEMQSLNEELMTINLQYQTKAEELAQRNNDIKNLLDSTQMATIFLNHELEIQRFTPYATQLFRIIESDIGRPINHINTNLRYPDLEADVREVLDKLVPREIQVETEGGQWYLVRINPYRTVDNFISGAVLTFTNVTEQKDLQFEYERIRQSMHAIIEAVREPMLVVNVQGKVEAATRSFITTFHPKLENIEGRTFFELGNGFWDTPEVRETMDRLFRGKQKEESRTIEKELGRGNKRRFLLRAQAIVSPSGTNGIVLLAVNGKE
jgi:two-component system CheB/CheR fusion protein